MNRQMLFYNPDGTLDSIMDHIERKDPEMLQKITTFQRDLFGKTYEIREEKEVDHE